MRNTQAGFTLLEMMVVVAIFGILATVAVVSVKSPQRPADVATRLANRVRECERLGVAGGPVRSDVLEKLGSRARARLVIARDGDDQLVSLEKLVEDEFPSSGAEWAPVSQSRVSHGISIAGYLAASELWAEQGPGDELPDELVFSCFPSGSTDPLTVYIDGKSESDRSRLVVIPVSGEAIVLAGW